MPGVPAASERVTREPAGERAAGDAVAVAKEPDGWRKTQDTEIPPTSQQVNERGEASLGTDSCYFLLSILAT